MPIIAIKSIGMCKPYGLLTNARIQPKNCPLGHTPCSKINQNFCFWDFLERLSSQSNSLECVSPTGYQHHLLNSIFYGYVSPKGLLTNARIQPKNCPLGHTPCSKINQNFCFWDFLKRLSSQSNSLECVSPTGYPTNSRLAEKKRLLPFRAYISIDSI